MMKIFALAFVGLLAALPAASFAATYAYVNTTGEVRTVEAATAAEAITTAPGIHIRGGVLLIDGSDDQAVVGDDVMGI